MPLTRRGLPSPSPLNNRNGLILLEGWGVGEGRCTGLLAAGRSSVGALQLCYWGRPVLWWSVQVVVGALEIVIRNELSVR